MKKKASWWQNVLLAAFVVALVFGAYQAEAVGNHLQYLVFPPEQAAEADVPVSDDPEAPVAVYKPNQPIADAVKRLKDMVTEWETLIEGWTVGGVMEQRTLICHADSKSARVELVGENGWMIRPTYLREGRQFYQSELEQGERAIILDEQLALALFHVADPVGEEVTLEGITYRIIGITRHAKRVGDLMEYGAYIPLMSVIDQSITIDALLVEAQPMKGTGAAVTFKKTMETWATWGKPGTFYDLGKEGMGAQLWLRALLFVAGMTLGLRMIQWLNARVRYYSKRYRQQLQHKYAVALMPELIGAILLFVTGYALTAGLIALLMGYMIQPVYTFPEWIPDILVEWESIAKAFWNVWQLPAVMMELRSPEILRLRWLDLLVKGCAAGAAVLLALRYARNRSLDDEMNDSLTGLYREGVLVSVLRTTKPIAMAELGYVACEESEAWQAEEKKSHRHRGRSTPMMRVINAERILKQLAAGKRDGSFVVEITDGRIEQNNHRWLITCKDGEKTIEEVSRDWDLQLPVETLTRIVYGSQKFADVLENNAGYDMKMHSPAMDGLFDQQLPLTRGAV